MLDRFIFIKPLQQYTWSNVVVPYNSPRITDAVNVVCCQGTMGSMKESEDIACYFVTKHSWKGK